MACPDCGCKTTYLYDEGDDMPGGDERLYRCAACGSVFDIEDEAPEEDEDFRPYNPDADPTAGKPWPTGLDAGRMGTMKPPNVVIEGQAEVGEARRSASPRM